MVYLPQGHVTTHTMPFPPPLRLPGNSHLSTWGRTWSTSAAPLELSQSLPASSEIFGSATSPSTSVLSALLFKAWLYSWGRTFSFLPASSELPSWKRRPATSRPPSLCRRDRGKGCRRHSTSGWTERPTSLLGIWSLESLRKGDLLRICLRTSQLYLRIS